MQILALQLDIVWEDPAANRAKVESLLRAAPPLPGALIVLPEMFATGFTMNVPAAARQHEQTTQFITELARQYSACVVAGLAVPGQGELLGRNQAMVADPSGKIIASYVKLHPFTLGGERDHYEAGSEVVTFDCGGFTIAPFICYDLRFPEVFRHAARRGANFFTVIANWPTARLDHWLTLLRARAIENQCYVLGVNRSGQDPHLPYPGRSMLLDPMGVVQADAGSDEGVLMAEANPDVVQTTRQRLPFQQDLRDEFLVS